MNSVAITLYGLLARCLLPLGLAYLWLRGRKDPDYRLRWGERLARAPVDPAWRGGTVLHCASVGEVLAARPLIEALLAEPHAGELVITCTTPTGSRMVRERYGARVRHAYFPLDLPGATRRFLQAWQPRRVLLMERELWPGFLHQARRAGVPVVLVNGRLSERSATSYQRWRGLMAPALAGLRLVCAEDDTAAAHFAALGVRPERLHVTGNIKSDLQLGDSLHTQVAQIRTALGTRPVLTAGSTHAGEDESLLEAFVRHLPLQPDTLLVLVPRHPERFEAVAQCVLQAGLRLGRRSQQPLPEAGTQVWLVDAMGELMRWYGAANVCFVGGSLIGRGGHNPLEVLAQSRPLLMGPHTRNFEPLCSQLQADGALLRVADGEAVFATLRQLLQDPAQARELATRGHAAFLGLTGATQRTMAHLQTNCPAPATALVTPHTARQGSANVWVHPDYFGTPDPRLLDTTAWPAGPATPRQAGRGQVHHVADDRHHYLLRHYYRGGLMARISRDLFLLQPVAQSRAMQEFTLLSALRVRGLPVPQPCAARRTRHALFWYRADILVERIPHATDVARLLHTERTLATDEWQRLGQAIRRMHDEQVHHSDLNCHNLMLDADGKAWIVDFDKCGFRAGEDWKAANLERLRRSLRKELRLDPGFRWTEAEWALLLGGYAAAAEGAPVNG